MVANQLLKDLLNYVFGNDTPTSYTAHHFALFTAMPDRAGSGGVEVTGGTGPYARTAINNDAALYGTDAVLGTLTKTTVVAITWNGLPAATIVGFGIYSAGGTLLAAQEFSGGAVTTASGDSLTLPIGTGLTVGVTA